MSDWLLAAGWVAAAAVTAALARSKRLLDERMDAIADACHEARGPLTAARLGLTLGLRRGRLEPHRLRALERELERAVRALDDLEQARCGRPAEPHRSQAVDVQGLLADSVAAWEGAAAARRRMLILSWSGPPVFVWGDRVRLAQAIGNLIANAVEHGSGPVEVRGSRGGGNARVEVSDRGPGLEAPVAELIRRRRRPGDRGRGLAIAGSIAAAHGGRLSSAPSQGGARIVLSIPVHAAPPAAQAGRA